MDHLAAARAAECRIDNTAIGCARTIQLRITIGCCEGRQAYSTTDQYRACNADTNARRYSHTKARHNPNSNGHAVCYANSGCNAEPDTSSNPNSNCDAKTIAKSKAFANSNVIAVTNPCAITSENAIAFAETNSDSNANAAAC